MPTTKLSKHDATKGKMGEFRLASGEAAALRLWDETDSRSLGKHTRPYETVGYVIEGVANLTVNGDTIQLSQGDSWVVPKGAEHEYHVTGRFVAIEATSPPARDEL